MPKVIKNENYRLIYSISKKSLEIDLFERIQNKNIKDFFRIYNKIITIAENKQVKSIYAHTWIFEENKNFAKKLGFEHVQGTGNNFFKILKQYPDYKIVKLNVNGITNKLILKKGKLIVSKTILKNGLPLYVKKI